MFPTSHDITRENVMEAVSLLRAYTASGNKVLVVSKPDPACIRVMFKELATVRGQITFRFTIGSADNNVLKFWEPYAPTFEQRLESLRIAYTAGFQTSVSCEPMLDNRIDLVVEAVRPFVTDTIWLGRVNNLMNAVALNCPNDPQAKQHARELLASQPDEWLQELHARYAADPLIRFKDSIKRAVGMRRPEKAGLDV